MSISEEFRGVKAEDLRRILIDSYGFSEDDAANIKGKAQLVLAIESARQEETNTKALEDDDCDDEEDDDYTFDDVMTEEEEAIQDDEKEVIPLMTDPGWHDYVMSQFTEDELYDGYPTVDGCRRVASLVLGGEVVSSKSEMVYYQPGHAVVKHTIQFEDEAEYDGIAEFGEMCCAKDGAGNFTRKDYMFLAASSSVAETKAESRAYRRAMKLRTITAEEAGTNSSSFHSAKNAVVDDETDSKLAKISDTQVSWLQTFSKRNDISLQKVVAETYPHVYNMSDLTEEEAKAVIGRCNAICRDEEEVKKFGPYEDWQNLGDSDEGNLPV